MADLEVTTASNPFGIVSSTTQIYLRQEKPWKRITQNSYM